MAETSITQRDRYCKVENNPKLNPIIDRYSHYGLEHYCLFAAILKRCNGEAADFLKSMGCTGIIPHTYHIPLEEAARFYNVGQEYLKSLLHRLGVNTTSVGNEYISIDPSLYFYRAGMQQFGKFAPVCGPDAPTTYDFVLNDSGEHYVMKTRRKITQFISARIILAVAPMIAHTYGSRGRDHASVRVTNAILERRYHVNKPLEHKAAEPVTKKAVEEAPKSPCSSATISKDELIGMIKQAVREVLADAKVEVPATFTIHT